MHKSKFSLKDSKRKSGLRKWLIAAGVMALFIVSYFGIANFVLNDEDSKTKDDSPIDTTISSDKSGLPKMEADSTSTDTSDVPVTDNFSLQISKFNQLNGFIEVEGAITGESSGECVFSFSTTDSKPVVKQSSIQTSEEGVRTCSIKVSEVEFDRVGEWNLELSLYSAGAREIAERIVTIN